VPLKVRWEILGKETWNVIGNGALVPVFSSAVVTRSLGHSVLHSPIGWDLLFSQSLHLQCTARSVPEAEKAREHVCIHCSSRLLLRVIRKELEAEGISAERCENCCLGGTEVAWIRLYPIVHSIVSPVDPDVGIVPSPIGQVLRKEACDSGRISLRCIEAVQDCIVRCHYARISLELWKYTPC
jgi:hypothetical protein